MLFNSYEFIFLYLPIVFVMFFWIARGSHRMAALWLAAASLFFYGWWNLRFVLLLLASIGFNFTMGYVIGQTRTTGGSTKKSYWILFSAIAANLVLLGFFKYTNFFISTVNQIAGTHWNLVNIVLPLGISFFTFTQIAFLVDTYRGIAKEYNWIHYILFVTYFPHLIAGPVLHHKQMMPQFEKASTYRFNPENLSVGITIFFIGLFKKVILADGLAAYADPVFAAPASGLQLSFIDAWGGALSYSLQLYFDFSGYSDMAIGLSRMFGVVLPLNFHSPYKSSNMIAFWRRWHMTLSHFLRDYLYIPLGGNRKGKIHRYVNLMITMLLGGLWHGSAWTFVIWGGMHGIFLIINHAWQGLCARMGLPPHERLPKPVRALAILLTFISVVMAWVVFRSDNFTTAIAILKAMTGGNGFVFPAAWLAGSGAFGQWLSSIGINFTGSGSLIGGAFNWICVSLFIVWFVPNTQQFLAAYRPALHIPEMNVMKLCWRPSLVNAVLVWGLGFIAIININKKSAFLYFQF